MRKYRLTNHVTRLCIGCLSALLVGWWLNQLILIPALFLVTFLVWQSYNSMRLYQWLQSWDSDPPESLGMWAEIFDRIASLQKLNVKRDQQFRAVISDFEGMADAFPDATLVIDSHDNIQWFNDSAVKLLGLKTPEDTGQAVTNLLREPAFANWLAVQGKIQGKLEVSCPTDNNITLQISAVRFRKNQRLLILRDVTDVQNLERMRRDLVANVSHELRTPLTVLLGYLEMLKDQTDQPDPNAIDRMYKQARQMHALLEDLLELSRLQEPASQNHADEVDIPAMLIQLEAQAKDISQDNYDLCFSIQPGLHMRGLEADLGSAFQNLVVNAIRYTPTQGRVQVSWQETDIGLIFSVNDSGVGISHRDIPRITERFYRVGSDRNRQTGGTGLGLAIVKHVLNNHDARLEISSALGEGSEFRCVFPLNRKV